MGPVAWPIETPIDPVPAPIEPLGALRVTRLLGALGALIQPLVDPIPAAVEALVDPVPARVQLLVDAIATLVEALLDAITAFVEALLDVRACGTRPHREPQSRHRHHRVQRRSVHASNSHLFSPLAPSDPRPFSMPFP